MQPTIYRENRMLLVQTIHGKFSAFFSTISNSITISNYTHYIQLYQKSKNLFPNLNNFLLSSFFNPSSTVKNLFVNQFIIFILANNNNHHRTSITRGSVNEIYLRKINYSTQRCRIVDTFYACFNIMHIFILCKYTWRVINIKIFSTFTKHSLSAYYGLSSLPKNKMCCLLLMSFFYLVTPQLFSSAHGFISLHIERMHLMS